jgi:hypothetical protein
MTYVTDIDIRCEDVVRTSTVRPLVPPDLGVSIA